MPRRKVTTRQPIQGPYALTLAARVRHLAELGRSVLISGASGVGKETLLRAYLDTFATEGETRIVNCAEFSPSLLESELFGHVKGAFTGAVSEKPALIENMACVALDEIGDASPEMQAKILRLLETGAYRKVGSAQTEKSSALFVAATNKPEALRRDLLWRFEARVHAPDLSARREDLVHILWAVAREVQIVGVTERCLGFLVEDYEWPGNVREVRFVVGAAAISANRTPIDLWDLPMPAGGYRSFPHYKWPGQPDPGRTWLLNDNGPEDAIAVFALSNDEESLAVFEKLGYQASINRMKLGTDEQEFSRRTLSAMGKIAKAIERIGSVPSDDLAMRISSASNWNEAAQMARRTWYQARTAEGLTRREIANRLGITPQALGQALKRDGIL